MASRALLVVFAVIYLVRFAVPALWGASAGGPFGEPWLPDGSVGTPMLDSDLRYWGLTSATIAAIFAYALTDLNRFRGIVDLVMTGVWIGGFVRLLDMGFGSIPAGPAVVATLIELVFPVLWWASTRTERAAAESFVQASVESSAGAESLWSVFADFGGVHDWHPYMESASLDPGPDHGVGAARVCRFGPKMAIRETVLEWSDRDQRMVIGIDFLEGFPPPLTDIKAAVECQELPEGRGRLILSLRYRTRMGPLGTLADPLIEAQYRGVFAQMLTAARSMAETGTRVPPVVMPGSGRRI